MLADLKASPHPLPERQTGFCQTLLHAIDVQIPSPAVIEIHLGRPVPPRLVDELVHEEDDREEGQQDVRVDKVSSVERRKGAPALD